MPPPASATPPQSGSPRSATRSSGSTSRTRSAGVRHVICDVSDRTAVEAAIALAPDAVRVNCVCPGTVDTPLVGQVAEAMPDDLDPRVSDRLMMMLPHGVMTVDEIAASIVYLASADARSVTGAVLAVDGAMG